jgi:hypothetical protein
MRSFVAGVQGWIFMQLLRPYCANTQVLSVVADAHVAVLIVPSVWPFSWPFSHLYGSPLSD